MPEVTIVYWRDIPAQIIVGKGRRGSKVQLSERFEQAIDRAAMKTGAAGTDDYLAEWRKTVTGEVEGRAVAVGNAVLLRGLVSSEPVAPAARAGERAGGLAPQMAGELAAVEKKLEAPLIAD